MAFIANPEISEYLGKMMRADVENAARNSELLYKLFSGEPCKDAFATENQRTLEENIFILGTYFLHFLSSPYRKFYKIDEV